jgi:molecular chaperone GrpE
VVREQTVLVERAAERLVEDLLPALDAFDLAMTSVAGLPREHEKVKKGIELTYAQLRGVLEKAGLERLDPVGEPFDPNEHEAVMHVEEGAHAEPTVVDVMRAGYRLKGRTLRPAMVKVAK